MGQIVICNSLRYIGNTHMGVTGKSD